MNDTIPHPFDEDWPTCGLCGMPYWSMIDSEKVADEPLGHAIACSPQFMAAFLEPADILGWFCLNCDLPSEVEDAIQDLEGFANGYFDIDEWYREHGYEEDDE